MMRPRVTCAVSVLLCVFVCVLCYSSPVSGNSGGLHIPCNVNPLFYPQKQLGTVDRKKAYQTGLAQNETNVVPMWWALKPDWADANDARNGYTGQPRYTLRSADGPTNADPTSYVPNQFVEIIIRTLNIEQQFAGLLMYAENSVGTRVGEWILPPRQNFQIDPNSGCVTHKNADPKNYKSVFRVRFPPGTGTVTIKALVKVGLAFPEMQGAFYWPNTNAKQWLTLTEAPQTQQQVTWIQGNVGQSCQQVCQANGGQCDLNTMRSVGSNPLMLSQAVSKSTGCFGPIMRGCGSLSPTMGTEGCFFYDQTCTRDPIQSQYDPCTRVGIKPYVSTQSYDSPTCVSYMGFLWCAKQFVNVNNPPSEGSWRKVAACGVSPTSPSLSFPQPTRTSQPMDCTSTKMSNADGQRLCACSGATNSGGNLPTSVYIPPTPAPSTQPPGTTSRPTTTPTSPTTTPTGPTQASTTRPPTQPPTTRPPTSPPTPAARDSISLINPPSLIPQRGSFKILIQYSALGSRTLAADILQPNNNYKFWGGGFINVASGSSGIVELTLTLQPDNQNQDPTPGSGYTINYWMVDQAVYQNGNNPEAWRQAIGTTTPAQVTITTDVIPTPAPTSAPTDAPDPTTTPTDPVNPTNPTPTMFPDTGFGTTPNPLLKNSGVMSTPSVTLLSGLLMLVFGSSSSFGSSRTMLMMTTLFVLLCTCIPGLHAHNWLTSPSRSNRGTGVNGNFNGWTTPPCPARSGRVHAQVGSGQRFQVEWASGHGYGSSTYLVVVAAENESLLRQLDEPLMDRYLAENPNPDYMSAYKAYHVFPGTGNKQPSWDFELPTTAGSEYKRPDNFRPYPVTTTWAKTADATRNDKRAAYTNPKWDWIIAVHRFALQEDRSEDMDGVLMEIPATQPAGSYIVYYFWRGYYDCMDVNVLGRNPVADVWGKALTPPVYGTDRVLHTHYPPIRPNWNLKGGCQTIMEFDSIDTTQCFRDCTQEYNQIFDQPCQAIIVAPIILPTSATMKGWFQNGQSHLPDGCTQAVNRIVNKNGTFVCYPVYGGTPPTVGPSFRTVNDPEDPIFYHTAYMIKKPWVFADQCTACQPVPPPIDWRFADQCISCADTATNTLTNIHPTWTFTNNCQHCDASLA